MITKNRNGNKNYITKQGSDTKLPQNGTTTNSEYKNKITTLVQTDRQADRQTVEATGA